VTTERRLADRIVSVPSSDAAFARAVADALVGAGVGSEADLERALRPLFPWTTVRRRELSSERMTTWYVYRDRDFGPAQVEPWWEAADAATLTLRAADGVVIEADAAVAALVDRDPDGIVGHAYTDLLDPRASSIAQSIWSVLLERGVVTTVVAMVRPDGLQALVEVRATVRGDLVDAHARSVALLPVPSPNDARA
jgi:PAS domain-containing protein